VKDVSQACKVDEKSLGDMVVDKPRTSSSPKPKTPVAPTAMPTTSASGQPGTGSRSSAVSATRGEAGQLKSLHQKTFQTSTMTLGSITGCLRRATNLTADEAGIIRDRLEAAADILNKTRIMVFKGLELFILNEVRSVPQRSEPLDVLLDKKHGYTIVRNLVALVLNGAIDNRGRPTRDPEAIRARSSAQSIYDDLCNELPELKPMKGSCKIPLSIPQMELAREIHCNLRIHYGRLPETIVTKVTKSCAMEMRHN
jgi:hypothetical protein